MSTLIDGLAGVPISEVDLPKSDFVSDAEVRWCPACGDYSILSTFQALLPNLGIKRENVVVVSGIGCSSRFPYYVDSYGFHSIHGRAPAIASGLAIARQDLAVFVATGDGDALSIGGNHLIHVLRRNVNMTIMLFNNQIYGLTKGQFSPTSEFGKITKSSPRGSVDQPFNPLSLALGAEASFIARAVDTDRAGLTAALAAGAHHRGTALIEILQNCLIFNDGAWDQLKGPAADANLIKLADGAPITWQDGQLGLVRDPVSGSFQVAEVAEVGSDHVVVHDVAHPDPSYAFALTRLPDLTGRTPVGIFRDVDRPAYGDLVQAQIDRQPDHATRGENLQRLLLGPDPWTIR